MKILHAALAAFVVAGLATTGLAEEKKTDVKKLLVGKWEVTKADPDTISVGSVVEFTADGKLKVREKQADMEMMGTYTVDGNSFSLALKFGDQEFKQKITVKKLTETELDTADPDKKGVTFKRVK
jgi:uncharacterized protein (TIGR03066 family)